MLGLWYMTKLSLIKSSLTKLMLRTCTGVARGKTIQNALQSTTSLAFHVLLGARHDASKKISFDRNAELNHVTLNSIIMLPLCYT